MTDNQICRVIALGDQLLAAISPPLESSQSESQAVRNSLVQLHVTLRTHLRILSVEVRTNRPSLQPKILKDRRKK